MTKPVIRVQNSEKLRKIALIARESQVSTVCEEALCPNLAECWSSGTATFMLMGDVCTRGCRFCYVKKGKPQSLDLEEPRRLIKAIKEMNLDYVTLTSVDRDDLPDGGASYLSETIMMIKNEVPNTIVELLAPDFQGDTSLAEQVISAGVDVFAHNIETVPSLQKLVRDNRANFENSTLILKYAKKRGVVTKSSILLGFGETQEEIYETFRKIVEFIDILVISQYLRPSAKQLPVKKIYTEDEFRELERKAYETGFKAVVAGKLARTSYRAKEAYLKAIQKC
ncbi:lipoyl synthase [Sulfolobales archaeon HS-7]|nr:lipoyl synthase [Sulfolobales archaeon HS-7]